MFRPPQPFSLTLAAFALLFAACDTSDAEQSPEPGSEHDATVAPSGAGANDAGSSSAAPLDAGADDANSQASSPTSEAGTRDAGRDAGQSMRADAGSADAAAQPPRNDGGASDAGSTDALSFAGMLNGMFIDVPCAANTPTPLAMGATCQHPTGTQHIEKAVTFGGAKGTVYKVKLRVRGIWEPTKIQGGERPDKAHPFTVGGMLPAGTGSSDAISYQQYSIEVSEPKQTYWLNDHQYLAHDIHKEDYQATLQIAAGARVTVIMNDGNDHEIANFTKDYFNDVPPYDKMPSLGQSLRLDVVSVETAP